MRICSWSVAFVALLGAPVIARAQSDRRTDDSVSRKPRPLSAPFRICAGGDVTLGTNLDPKWAKSAADTLRRRYGLRSDPDSLAQTLRPFVQGADVLLLNVEGAIGAGPAPRKCGPRSTSCFAFRQPRGTAAALRRLVDSSVAVVGNIANNHSRDAGDDGRDTTIAYLRAAGIRVTGDDTLATPVPLATRRHDRRPRLLHRCDGARCAGSCRGSATRRARRRAVRDGDRHDAPRRRGGGRAADAQRQ